MLDRDEVRLCCGLEKEDSREALLLCNRLQLARPTRLK